MIQEKSKYYIPETEELFIGYECEVKFRDERWRMTKLNFSKFIALFNTVDDGNFPVRTPYLTHEQIESFGFKRYAKSIDHWYKVSLGELDVNIFGSISDQYNGYKPYHIFLNYGFHDQILKIRIDFSADNDFDKADSMFDGRCKSINEFKQVLTFLGFFNG